MSRLTTEASKCPSRCSTLNHIQSSLESLRRYSIQASHSARPTKVQKGGRSTKKLQSPRSPRWIDKLQDWLIVQPDQCESCCCFNARVANEIVTDKPATNIDHKAMKVQNSRYVRLKVAAGSSARRLKLRHWPFLMRTTLVLFLEVLFLEIISNYSTCSTRRIT